ncbi:hypothetical protein RND71_014881 [Anisodus tanguticus]|uniref:Uncharacterized protein n=1 Tax=Anisodus tanguticus TaxID=243964 RepID=A0AAE1VK98_9SOLA|nr:hypothetical protein RND71_014881 [Anisodus tanguticus]
MLNRDGAKRRQRLIPGLLACMVENEPWTINKELSSPEVLLWKEAIEREIDFII